jgi:hypothetical protein
MRRINLSLGIDAKNKPGEDGERATEAIHRAKSS